MAELNLNGVGVALITPFNQDDSIDFDSLGKLVDHVIDGGCDYIVALGTTAETPTLSRNERYDVAEFIKDKNAGRCKLVIGIGGNCTSRVIDDLSFFNLNGYSAILSVAPFYNKPTQEGLFQHFSAIAEASPIPMVLYNVPGRTGVNITAKTVERLVRNSNNICAVKEASGNFEQCEEIIKNVPSHFSLISGDDSATCTLMTKGAKGVISVLANAFPGKVKEIVRLCQSSRFEEGQKCQQNLSAIISHIFEDGNPAGIKYVLYKLGIAGNKLRLPLVPVSQYVEKKLDNTIKELS